MSSRKPDSVSRLFVAIFLVASQTTTIGWTGPRSTSVSKQLVVYSPEPALRGMLCDRAERAKAGLLRTLNQRDYWKIPIIINVRRPETNRPELPALSLRLGQTGSGLRLQLDLILRSDLDDRMIEREFVRVLLIELMYRSRPNLAPGCRYAEPPAWLVDGMVAATDGDEDSQACALMAPAGRVSNQISLKELLQQEPESLDSPSGRLYRVHCLVLLRLLIESPNGPIALGRFIDDLPDSSNAAVDNLRSHFAVLGDSAETAEKTWRLAIARLTSRRGFQSLSITETEMQLDHLLCPQFPGHGKQSHPWKLEDFPEFIHRPDRVAVLRRLNQDLIRLDVRAHPALRPIILDYRRITNALSRGRSLGISGRLTRLGDLRRKLLERISAISDYMNWFEATQLTVESKDFGEYLKAAAKQVEAIKRHGPISVYLDAFEIQFSE